MSTKMHGSSLGDHDGVSTAHDPNESVASADLSHDSPTLHTSTHAKICCSCGVHLEGERRYKDAQGRYWCCDCAKTDSEKKHPALCPECNHEVAPSSLVDFEGKKICPGCKTKHEQAAKRVAARKAAAEEEALLQQRRYRMMIISASVGAALIVGYAIYRVLG